MTTRRPALLVVVAALLACSPLAAVAVGPATAAPPPEAVCGVCGPGLVDAAEDAGVPLTVERGAATIRVSENGSGHWHARVRVDDDAADRLAANATLRERVVRASLDRRTVVDDPRNLQTGVANDTLVVSFAMPDVAHRSVGGVVLVDLLDPRTRRSGLDLEADELRIEGPNGTVVSRAPPSAVVEGGSIVWRADDADPGLWGDTRLAFAPTDGPAARGLTTVGFVASGVAMADAGALFLGVIPALALGVLLVVVRRWGGELPAVDPSLLAKGIVACGTVAAAIAAGSLAGLGLLVPGVAETVLSFTALYALVGACALAVDRPSPRVALAWTLGVSALVALAASTLSIVAFQTALLSIPAALWFPLGRARGRDRAVSGFSVAATLLTPFGAGILYQPTVSPVFGLLGSLLTTVPWAAATALFGVPLYLLGRGLDERAGAVGDADRSVHASTD